MPGVYGGLIVIIMYSIADQVVHNDFALITEDSIPIFTESSEEILVEV